MGIVTLGKQDNLYWLGRYLERVYQSLNMFRITYDKMLDDDREYFDAECERMGIPNHYESSIEFARGMAFDTENPNSIMSNLYRAYDNAMVMRDEITTDALAYIHLALADMKKARESDAPLYEMLMVKDHILAFWGCLDDEVADEGIRNTVKIGKRIERIDIFLRREAAKEDLSREIDRLASRISTTDLPYNKAALMYAAAIIEDAPIDYEAAKKWVWQIVPPM